MYELRYKNNLDLIRIFAAVEVMVSHSIKYTCNLGEPFWRISRNIVNFFPGVMIFFIISGFLITKAVMNSEDWFMYSRNRFLRIWPALCAATLLAVGLLLIFGSLDQQRLGSSTFWLWLLSQLTVFQSYKPAIFSDFGQGIVNGPLWTISVEIIFYVFLPLFAVLVLKRLSENRVWISIVLGSVLLFSFILYQYIFSVQVTRPYLFDIVYNALPTHLWSFFIGSLIYL